MEVPVKNLVETVELTAEDVLLPMLECVVNSIISLQQSPLPIEERKIQIQISRGEFVRNGIFESLKSISSYKIIDNGIGFNSKNYSSFQTPFSQINKDFGCKGIGRFTVLAAYDDFLVDSNYEEDKIWKNRKFKFSTENEIEAIKFENSNEFYPKTIVSIGKCTNSLLYEKIRIINISDKRNYNATLFHILSK